jgi:hypothetical protein
MRVKQFADALLTAVAVFSFLAVDCIVTYTTLLADLSRPTAQSFENDLSDILIPACL